MPLPLLPDNINLQSFFNRFINQFNFIEPSQDQIYNGSKMMNIKVNDIPGVPRLQEVGGGARRGGGAARPQHDARPALLPQLRPGTVFRSNLNLILGTIS